MTDEWRNDSGEPGAQQPNATPAGRGQPNVNPSQPSASQAGGAQNAWTQAGGAQSNSYTNAYHYPSAPSTGNTSEQPPYPGTSAGSSAGANAGSPAGSYSGYAGGNYTGNGYSGGYSRTYPQGSHGTYQGTYPSSYPGASQQQSGYGYSYGGQFGAGTQFGAAPQFGGTSPFGGAPQFGPAPVKRRSKGTTAILVIIGMVVALLVGTGVGYFGLAPEPQASSPSVKDPFSFQYNDGLTAPNDGRQQGGAEPYMPIPRDFPTQLPGGNHGADGPIDRGEKVSPAGVAIINARMGSGMGAGSGIVLTADGQVLTNYHVVMGSDAIQVEIPATGKTYAASVIGHDEKRDVALLQLKDASGLTPAKIASTPAKQGDKVSAVGNGRGQGYLTEIKGEVTGLGMDVRVATEDGLSFDTLKDMIVTDADVVPGYSGGPMMNAQGEVVGMNSAASQGTTSAQVYGFAIPIERALSIVEQIRAGKSDDSVTVGKNAALGITVGLSEQGRVSVLAVGPNSGAAKAGIKEGDTILSLDGQSVSSPAQVAKQVRTHKVGDTITLEISRGGGAPQTIEVTLGESPVN
ncbi:trypsin-like peptidase domain-containing protein [Actinotignum schaalii]|uniref:S1C family serine protease n=1 Tax=Actinotignum schaalii TaxID=59505 RepID=UPI00373FB4D4